MPTYEYRCSECGKTIEALQKMSDAPLTKCPSCGKESLKRGPGGGSGFLLQGGGWYKSSTSPVESKEPPSDSKPSTDSSTGPSKGGCSCGKKSGGCH